MIQLEHHPGFISPNRIADSADLVANKILNGRIGEISLIDSQPWQRTTHQARELVELTKITGSLLSHHIDFLTSDDESNEVVERHYAIKTNPDTRTNFKHHWGRPRDGRLLGAIVAPLTHPLRTDSTDYREATIEPGDLGRLNQSLDRVPHLYRPSGVEIFSPAYTIVSIAVELSLDQNSVETHNLTSR